MLNTKKSLPDNRQNPGVMIGFDEMPKFIDFVKMLLEKKNENESEKLRESV